MLIDLLRSGRWTWDTLVAFIAMLVAVAVAITVHEYAHARSAKSYGDDTAEAMGRLTLNPAKHYDPIGSTLFLLFGFGWAKPVPVQPYRMRNPRFDGMRTALWGPLSNVLLASSAILIWRYVPGLPGWSQRFLDIFVTLNLFLAFFNMIPLPPLDGSRIWTYFLPDHMASRFERFSQQYGFLVLMALVFFADGLLMRAFDAVAGLLIRVLISLPF